MLMITLVRVSKKGNKSCIFYIAYIILAGVNNPDVCYKFEATKLDQEYYSEHTDIPSDHKVWLSACYNTFLRSYLIAAKN